MTTDQVPRFERYRPGIENRLDYVPPAAAVALVLKFAEVMEHVFRFEVRGYEHLRSEGPAVIVANHGIMPIEMFFLGARYFKDTGKLFRGITDPRTFKTPLIRDLWTTLGVVEGTPANAAGLLERGEKIAIMPGGAREAFKSTRQRYKIRWEGRMGFLKVALRGRVPIIPVACVGVDHMYYVLNDSYRFEKLFREWLGTKLVPITFFVGLGGLPFPAKLTQTVGAPIRFEDPDGILADPERLAVEHARVAGTMQSMLDEGLRTYDPFER